MQVIRETDRVLSIEAGQTEARAIQIDRSQKALEAQIVKSVKSKELFDFLNRVGGCNKLLAGGKINPIKARITVRRTTYSHMDLLGSGLSERLDTVARGGTTDNGILYDYKSPVVQQGPHRVQFYFYMKVKAAPEAVKNITRNLRLQESILRAMMLRSALETAKKA